MSIGGSVLTLCLIFPCRFPLQSGALGTLCSVKLTPTCTESCCISMKATVEALDCFLCLRCCCQVMIRAKHHPQPANRRVKSAVRLHGATQPPPWALLLEFFSVSCKSEGFLHLSGAGSLCSLSSSACCEPRCLVQQHPWSQVCSSWWWFHLAPARKALACIDSPAHRGKNSPSVVTERRDERLPLLTDGITNYTELAAPWDA